MGYNYPALQTQLAIMGDFPDLAAPIGIFRDSNRETYDDLFYQQIVNSIKEKGKANLKYLLNSGDTWIVKWENWIESM